MTGGVCHSEPRRSASLANWGAGKESTGNGQSEGTGWRKENPPSLLPSSLGLITWVLREEEGQEEGCGLGALFFLSGIYIIYNDISKPLLSNCCISQYAYRKPPIVFCGPWNLSQILSRDLRRPRTHASLPFLLWPPQEQAVPASGPLHLLICSLRHLPLPFSMVGSFSSFKSQLSDN